MEGDIEELQRQLVPHREIVVTLLGEVERAHELLFSLEGVALVEEMKAESGNDRLHVTLQGEDESVAGMLKTLVTADIPVLHFAEETRDLEEVFMRVTKGIVS